MAGRALHAGDVDAASVAVINETLARNIGGNALGARIRYAASGAEHTASPWYEVVGIVRDDEVNVYGRGERDFVYLPASAAAVDPLVVGIHFRGDANAVAQRLRAIATSVEPGLRLYELLSLAEVVRRTDLSAIQGTLAVLAITILVMLLSAAGLYSLMSVAVTRRTREIGIRLAIGASPRAVLAALFRRAAVQVGIGILIGNVLLTPLMSALGFSELTVRQVLPAMLVAAGGMLLVGLLACGLPARRALRIEPTEAVRYGG